MLDIRTNVEFATFSDAAEISDLSQKYIEYNLRRVYTPSRIRESIRNTSKNVVVARKDGGLAGFGIMTYREDTANLDLLAVKRSYRRRGVGTQVVLWLEKVACSAGIANIFVQVRQTNSGATRFYENLGFHIIGEAAGYYQGKEAAVIMCKGIRQMFCKVREVEANKAWRP